MTERIEPRPDQARRHGSAPRPPSRSEMNFRDGRPDLELYDVVDALHECSDDSEDVVGTRPPKR